MGPHSYEQGNSGASSSRRTGRGALQWGLTLTSKETRDVFHPCAGPGELQWGLTLTSKETRQTISLPKSSRRFNGASLLRARKPVGFRRRRTSHDEGASMGPHSYEQGNSGDYGIEQLASKLQWGLTLTSKETLTARLFSPQNRNSFNGASLLRARKQHLLGLGQVYLDRLQWGLTLTSKETRCQAGKQRPDHQASMGPHSYEQGNEGDRPQHRLHAYASMGPHSYEQGNSSYASSPVGVGLLASMGPHSYEQGNLRPPAPVAGRRDASMGPHSYEQGNTERIEETVTSLTASMGPHSYEQGNWVEEAQGRRRLPASMGPHSYEQGNESRVLPERIVPVASMGPHSYEQGNRTSSTAPLRKP